MAVCSLGLQLSDLFTYLKSMERSLFHLPGGQQEPRDQTMAFWHLCGWFPSCGSSVFPGWHVGQFPRLLLAVLWGP